MTGLVVAVLRWNSKLTYTKEAKESMQQAAHSIMDWYFLACFVRRFLICCIISLVIGRRILGDLVLADSFRMPFRRWLTLKVNCESNMWWHPSVTCACLTADR